MTKIRYITITLAIIGLVSGIIYSLTYGNVKPAEPQQIALPPSSPFRNTISGLGVAESSCTNVNVMSQDSGLLAKLLVNEGDIVKAGDVLFQLDDKMAIANLSIKERNVEVAKTNLDLAKVALEDQEDQLKRLQKLLPSSAVSLDKVIRKTYAVKQASAQVANAQATLESAIAAKDQARVALEQLYVKAPIDGSILKIYFRAGEYLNLNNVSTGVILMKCIGDLNLRVQIDENDLWRFTNDLSAKAFLRSNKEVNYPLTFVRVEPYVQPKTQLNGDSTERVDSRVLEVIYKIEPSKHNLFVGQLLDVFIETRQ